MPREYIIFDKQRNFGDKLSATFEFLKNNYKGLLNIIISIPGPFILLNAFIYVFFVDSKIRSITDFLEGNMVAYTSELASILLIYSIIVLLSTVIFQVSIISFIKIYRQKKSGDITASEVWAISKTDIVKLTLFYIILGFISVLFITILVSMASSNGGFIASLLIFIIFFVLFYLLIVFSLIPYIIVVEDKPVGDFFGIINRSFFLIRGKWWSTFGLLLISVFISSAISGIFSLPVGVSQMTKIFSQSNEGFPTMSTSEMVYSGIVQVVSNVVYIIPVLALSFQYFNLVEKNEGKGLLQEIQDVDSDHDEGEGGKIN